MLGALELLQHDLEGIVAEGEVFHLGVLIAGEAAALEIGGEALRFRRQVLRLAGGGRGDQILCLRLNVVVAADHQPVAEVGADEEI